MLLVIYLLFTLKTIMDRSAIDVIKETSWLPIIVVGINAMALLEARFRRAPILLGSLALGCAGIVLVAAARPELLPRFRPPGPSNLASLRDCLRPTDTPEAMLRPTTDPVTDDILTAVKEIKGRLDENAVKERELLVYHSAAQVYHLLGRKLPTKFYCLGWAAGPAMEQDLIRELERNRVRAFLRVKRVGGAMIQLDVPDSYRIPLVHRYIADKEAVGRRFDTALGTLTILEEGRDAFDTRVNSTESRLQPSSGPR